jgi:hypothetical protein
MPDVLMLTQHDWANTGWRFFKCVQSLGIDVMALKGEYHRMAYPEQIPIHPCLTKKSEIEFPLVIPELAAYAKDAKLIHFFTSRVIVTGVDLFKKKVVMQHGGSGYRNNYEFINNYCNQFVDASIIQCPDLLGLGANNESWIYYPVDTEFIKPDYTTGDKLVIGHFPSNPEVKGTSRIVEVVDKLRDDFDFSYIGCTDGEWSTEFIRNNLLTWTENLKRLQKCDIIIETLTPDLGGEKYGEWGNTALEAAALGKIVVTNSLSIESYEKEFGACALCIANDATALENQLRMLLSLSKQEIRNRKQETRIWAELKHSMPVTAQRIWNKVYIELL